MWAARNIFWMKLLMVILNQYCMGWKHYFVSQVIDVLSMWKMHRKTSSFC